MDHKAKICMITPGELPVPAVLGGAIETLMTELIESNRKEEEIEITVCSPYSREAVEYVKGQNYENVSFFWAHLDSFWNQIKFLLHRVIGKIFFHYYSDSRKYEWEIKKFLKRHSYDLVIAEGGNFASIAHIAQAYAPDQLVLHLHHHYLPEKEIIQKSFGHIIGVSRFVTEEYSRGAEPFPVKKHILYNAIKPEQFSQSLSPEDARELRSRLGLSETDFLVLYVGRIIEEKGVKELIQAVLKIPQEDVKLLMIGSANFGLTSSTPYEKEIDSLIQKNLKRIISVGYIDHSMLYQYLNIADVQCVPSKWEEAAGLVVLEGMAQGLPLIITNSGGMVEYVAEGNVRIIEREDLVEKLRNSILYLKDHPEVREHMRRNSHIVKERYNQHRYYQNFCKIVRDILRENRKKKEADP